MEFMEVINYLARWGHYVFGIAWIGLLYYFNFVQGGFAANASDSTKVELFTKLVPTALWYFRWAAMLTFLTGLVLLYFVHSAGTLSGGLLIGGLMATIMFLNVWLVIWPNQKIVIASNESVAGGGEADPGQAAAAAKALLASRTNTFLSLPMLYLMGSTVHGGLSGSAWNQPDVAFWVLLVIVLLIEANALFGKTGPLTTVKGVIGSSVVLTVVVMAVLAWL
ncbi:MAG: urate hydroxylase PuuD [Pseudomonadales bacterium]|nr:urate hydroxylase PuuD [Pseudomonadales bacterium]